MKLLLTGAVSWSEEQKNSLRELGNEILYIQDERIPLKEQSIDTEKIEGAVCNGLFLYNNIEDFKSLKYIQLTSAGFDRVPMDYIQKHQIEIHNARGVYSIPMAEFAVSGVLQLYKQSHFFYENQKNGKWEKHRYVKELYDKTICIAGCGNVGTECAKRFQAFGCRVIGVDLYPRTDENYEEMISLEEFENVLPESDVVVLTLPLTDETKHLMNEKKLNLLKKGAILVNIARGAVLDTDALIRVLPKLGGAVLDVFEEEPLSEDSLLWKCENVIITPHNSFVGEGNRTRLQKVILKNITRNSK
ncbi:MAG: NAD(P)-dependent oxidoreductase [Eubacteriales bacterium]|nr:NAD(P)-dependent oxidoreductase [Eubacteriales bacterium]